MYGVDYDRWPLDGCSAGDGMEAWKFPSLGRGREQRGREQGSCPYGKLEHMQLGTQYQPYQP